jgi:CBS domain-containing protein
MFPVDKQSQNGMKIAIIRKRRQPMKASDFMTRTVITIDEQAPIAEALQLMLGKAISGLPVVDCNNQLVGIITQGDLLRRAQLATDRHVAWWKHLLLRPRYSALEYVRTHRRSVASVMTRETLCIAEDTPLSMIVRIMEQGQVKRLPVTKDGKVIGIVSRRDVLQLRSAVVGDPHRQIVAAVRTNCGKYGWPGARRESTMGQQSNRDS